MKGSIRFAQFADLERVGAFYRAWGYNEGFQPTDAIWIAEESDELVGVVRVAKEHGVLILRGMRVAESRRRQGIGSQMLQQIDAWLGQRECYCVPYSHLSGFYELCGFQKLLEQLAPVFLQDRLVSYRQRGLNVILMRRDATATVPSPELRAV